VGIAVVKAIRNTDGTIEDFQCEFANRRTVEGIGKDPTGMTLTAYGKDATVQLEYFKEAIAAGKKITYTIKTEVGGVERWILLSNASFGNDRVVQAWEDITEIKKTEQQVLALQEQLAERAQDKYQTLFNSINEGFCIIEKLEVEAPVDFRFIEANPAFKAHTGADVEEVIGMTIREAFPQESEEWFQIYDEIVKTGKEAKFERAMDSQDKILELYAFRVNDEAARRVAVVFRDITERKRAELKLRESKELMENIAGTIPDMISVQEYPSRKMIYFNRDAYRTNGLDIDDMKNMTVEQRHALIHPDDEPGLRKFADSLASLSNGQVATHEYRSKTKTKDWIWLRVRSKVFERDEQGNVTSIVNVIQNITDRKEAEQKIRDDHDLLQSIIGSSLSTIRVMNAVRNAEGEIVNFRYVLKNNSVGGYTDTDRIGKLFSEIHPDLMESEMFNNFKKVVQTGERVDFQVELDMGLEGDRWIRSVLVKLGDGFVSASEDITDRKRLETNAAFLVDIQNDLGHLQDEEQILTTVGSKIGRFMNAATCMLVEIDQQLDGARPRYLWRREGMPKSSSQFHISDFVKEQAKHLLNSGKTIVVRDVDNDPLVNSAPHRSIQALSSIKVPLSRNNQWKYLIIVNDSKPRDWRRDEIEVFQEFAYRLSTRIERARAEAMQRQLEETLRSQLENKVQQRGEELKKTRELLQSVSDAANNLLAGFNIVYSPNGEVEDFELLMCNKVMAFVIGQNSERLSGARYSMIFPASIRNGGFERIKEVARTGIPADFELWYSREETGRWFRCSVSKLSNMIILNGKDITELKKIHTDQQQSLELLRRAETLVKTISNGATGMRDEIKNIRKMIGGAIDAATPEKDKPE
jgi:PAS domain S-box-containing protein